jgi:soluble lytic murein transglycosylase-like protein
LIAIIYDAADRYGQPREDMLRVARCESDLVPTAVNGPGGSYGLFQFKPPTWLGTPFAEYDIFDPRANANAAAWMWAQGRRREWVCQ